MRSSFYAALAVVAATKVAGHSLFQDLWVDGVDMGSQCVRMPGSNSPVTNVNSNDIRCNVGGSRGVSGKCAVKAGSTVTVEMHAQPGDRSCGSEAIGGAHYGPVNVYLSQVPDASTADGSTPWYKIFADSWSAKGSVGDGDNWGTNDLNSCCGKMDVPIPADTPAGDYLLRAEVIALHTASSAGGAQFYVSCYQITVAGNSAKAAALPAGVKLPGALKSSDPGIQINIHSKMASYVNPGPAVIASGTTKQAGSGCSAGCAKTCAVGSGPVGTAIGSAPKPTSGAGDQEGCSLSRYSQCGGQGYSGCTTCAEGLTCKEVSAPYYSQCA
ncbi:carbohydrate-binding module family 1 protein [Hypoxylon cercidicola]|nr:carbohydrate-binding module family 1 protein [Hypoxylon cercidicola]